jgi:hypothetical protein
MLLPGKLNVCLSLCTDYAINIMHEHVQLHVTNLPSLSLHSSPYTLIRGTVVTSDGGSILMTLLSLAVSKRLKLQALECRVLSFT